MASKHSEQDCRWEQNSEKQRGVNMEEGKDEERKQESSLAQAGEIWQLPETMIDLSKAWENASRIA